MCGINPQMLAQGPKNDSTLEAIEQGQANLDAIRRQPGTNSTPEQERDLINRRLDLINQIGKDLLS